MSYELLALPYDYDALEPTINARIMELITQSTIKATSTEQTQRLMSSKTCVTRTISRRSSMSSAISHRR